MRQGDEKLYIWIVFNHYLYIYIYIYIYIYVCVCVFKFEEREAQFVYGFVYPSTFDLLFFLTRADSSATSTH